MTDQATITVDGNTIPLLGFGTWQLEPADARRMVAEALRIGYRHIDTAWIYKNEAAVGDGIRDAIEAGHVAREDIWLGAVTGKSRRGLETILEGHGLKPHFLFCRTADDCPSKPHPAMVTECCDEAGIAPRETIVIGDAIYDMQMAKAAGATAIGVAWGYAKADDLWKAGADAVVERPADLLAYIH